jgi:tRNA dimethylallyltransferase
MAEPSPRDGVPLRALALVGPTAAGKSKLALTLAESIGTSILWWDSVQVYRGLDNGSAKPGAAERARVPHRMLDLVDPDQEFSAGRYAELALTELATAGGKAIICGGTGLYLRATGWTHSGEEPTDHADQAGQPDEAAQQESQARSSDHGDAQRREFEARWMARESSERGAIHRELVERDPETAHAIHPNNAIRALRALWLCERHGEPISAVRRRDPPRERVELLMLVLDPGVEAVDAAIDARCEAMLAAGWVGEVEMLRARGYDARHKAMRSLGYRELLESIEGRCSLDQARVAIRRATRDYARRQRTYFRHQFRELLPMERIIHIDHPDATPIARIENFLLRLDPGQSPR